MIAIQATSDRVHQDRLERRDLHDEGRAEILAVRLSVFTAVRRCDLDGIKRDRHEESGAVDLSGLIPARLHREQIAAPLHQTIIPLETKAFPLVFASTTSAGNSDTTVDSDKVVEMYTGGTMQTQGPNVLCFQ